ncbi:MAG: phosphatase PAP2 family protein [Cyclobacteriaceae bacterium]|nr:phosphatase PAP2 family protein [Cyclobacteriaceae bacterium]
MKTFYKKVTQLFFIFFAISIVAGLQSCSKEVETKEIFGAQNPSRLDETAGTWRGVLLTNYAMQVPIPSPAAVSSDAYKAEITQQADAQSKLTAEQKKTIEYWSAGGVLRWNQIMRGLVARYNLPPAPRSDGSYVFPDAENPYADPAFPFANPPYAARAYSYVTVAQYDALKAAWYYKYQFNRAAPYTNDGSVKALVPVTNLPAYPSEDAVVSGVTAEMLKVIFPAAIEEITLRAAEQRNAALWSGKASYSDISSGLALGKAVATIFTANSTGTFTVPGAFDPSTTTLSINVPSRGRFRTDGIGNAVGNAALWQSLIDGATARGEIPWLSQEVPPRPPMLPNFGKVLAWNLSASQIVAERPQAPPSTSSEAMKTELAEVKKYADNATREELAIVYKWADGAGTYAPPGHWNDIASEYISKANFSEVRAARAFALLNMAMHDAAVGCWETKYFYFNPRPTQLDPSIRTKTGLPNFPAYTSGHSTFSFAAASVLSYLFPEQATFFNG